MEIVQSDPSGAENWVPPEGYSEIFQADLVGAFQSYSSKNPTSDDFPDKYKMEGDDASNANKMWRELNAFFFRNGLTIRHFKNDDEEDPYLYEIDLFVNIGGVNKFVGKCIFRMHSLSNFEVGDRNTSGRKESWGNSVKFDWTNVVINGFGAAILMQLYIVLLAAANGFPFFDKDDCSALSLKGNRFNNILWSYFIENWSLMSDVNADKYDFDDNEPDIQSSQSTQDLENDGFLVDHSSDEEWSDSQEPSQSDQPSLRTQSFKSRIIIEHLLINSLQDEDSKLRLYLLAKLQNSFKEQSPEERAALHDLYKASREEMDEIERIAISHVEGASEDLVNQVLTDALESPSSWAPYSFETNTLVDYKTEEPLSVGQINLFIRWLTVGNKSTTGEQMEETFFEFRNLFGKYEDRLRVIRQRALVKPFGKISKAKKKPTIKKTGSKGGDSLRKTHKKRNKFEKMHKKSNKKSKSNRTKNNKNKKKNKKLNYSEKRK